MLDISFILPLLRIIVLVLGMKQVDLNETFSLISWKNFLNVLITLKDQLLRNFQQTTYNIYDI